MGTGDDVQEGRLARPGGPHHGQGPAALQLAVEGRQHVGPRRTSALPPGHPRVEVGVQSIQK